MEWRVVVNRAMKRRRTGREDARSSGCGESMRTRRRQRKARRVDGQ